MLYITHNKNTYLDFKMNVLCRKFQCWNQITYCKFTKHVKYPINNVKQIKKRYSITITARKILTWKFIKILMDIKLFELLQWTCRHSVSQRSCRCFCSWLHVTFLGLIKSSMSTLLSWWRAWGEFKHPIKFKNTKSRVTARASYSSDI